MRNANAQRKDIMIRVDASQTSARAACQSCGDRVVSPFRVTRTASSRATDSRIERTRI